MRVGAPAASCAPAGGARVSEPRRNADPAVVAAKLARLREPHVAPITDLRERVAGEVGAETPAADPDWGGTDARLLVLLRDPGATTGPDVGAGLIGPDDDDPTAARVHELVHRHRLAARDVLVGHVVPWRRSEAAGPSLDADTLDAGNRWLGELLRLLPQLRVIAVLGRGPQTALARTSAPRLDGVVRIDAPHPGRGTQTAPERAAALDDAFRLAASIVRGGPVRAPTVDLWPTPTA